MKRRSAILTLTTLAIVALIGIVFTAPAPAQATGTTPISGIGYYANPGECADGVGDYALTMTGSLTGCHYIFIESSGCTAGGVYVERGTELFDGMLNGQSGTFKTIYLFTAKYKDCPNFVEEVAGRCEHPIVAGSGTGVFEGVTGRFDMHDDTEAGNFPYQGHLRW